MFKSAHFSPAVVSLCAKISLQFVMMACVHAKIAVVYMYSSKWVQFSAKFFYWHVWSSITRLCVTVSRGIGGGCC